MKNRDYTFLYYALISLFVILSIYLMFLVKRYPTSEPIPFFNTILAIFFGLAILNLWKVSGRISEKFDTGILWLMLTQVLWAFGGLMGVCLENKPELKLVSAIISTMNSGCFLMLIPYFDIQFKEKILEKKLFFILWNWLNWIKRNKTRYIQMVVILVFLFCVLERIHYYNQNDPQETDFWLSLVTIVLLGSFLWLVFRVREMSEFLPLIFISLIATLLYHVIAVYLPENSFKDLISLTYRFTLPLVWILLIGSYITDHQIRKIESLNLDLEHKNKGLKEALDGKNKALEKNEIVQEELKLANLELERQRSDMNHAIVGSLNNLMEDIKKDDNAEKDSLVLRLSHIYFLHRLLHVNNNPRISLFTYLEDVCNRIFGMGKYESVFNVGDSIKIDRNTYTSIKNMRDIGSVIFELANNAYKAKQDRQILHIEVYQNSSHLLLKVKDFGKGGIQLLDEIPYKGFGLNNVKNIIERNLDGFIKIEPQEVGTCFIIGFSLSKLNLRTND